MMVSSVGTHHVREQDQPPKAKKMKIKLTEIPREMVSDLQYNLIDVKLLQRNVLDRSDFILLNSYQTNEEKVEILMELMRNKNEEDHNNFLEIMEEDYKWLRDKCEIYLQKIRLDALQRGLSPVASVSSAESNNQKEELETQEENDRSSHEENDRSSHKENDRSSLPDKRSHSSPDSTVVPPRSKENVKKSNMEKAAAPVVNDKYLNQPITSEMMTVVRRNHRVVRKWTTLAHVMGMTSIAHTLKMRMLLNGEDQDTCVLQLLEEWKGAHPKEASLGKLILILREEDFNDVADELETKFGA